MSLAIPTKDQILVERAIRWSTFCLDFDVWSDIRISMTLDWKEIKFGDLKLDDLDSKEGIYMFIAKPNDIYNKNHAYILYIGETSDLKKRYLQYLNVYKNSTEPSDQVKRKMVIIWKDYLYFNYIVTDFKEKKKREELEYNLIDSIVPPFNFRFRSEVVNTHIKLYRYR